VMRRRIEAVNKAIKPHGSRHTKMSVKGLGRSLIPGLASSFPSTSLPACSPHGGVAGLLAGSLGGPEGADHQGEEDYVAC